MGFQSTLPTRGSDCLPWCVQPPRHKYFNPRSPRGGATCQTSPLTWQAAIFQSTLPTRGSDRVAGIMAYTSSYFNPRSPRGGATIKAFIHSLIGDDISIHAPHEGERQSIKCPSVNAEIFQSTLPTRGSDRYPLKYSPNHWYFNPRSPRGGATFVCVNRSFGLRIFQSTLPTRGSDG